MESISEAEYLEKYGDPLREVKIDPRDYDAVPQTTDEKLDELLTLLRPLGPVLEQLPEMMKTVGPLIEGIKQSPVLRALGVRIP